MMEERLAARIPMGMFTVNVKTGEVKTIHKSTDWLNHLEFSPTDPTLLMFCTKVRGTRSTASGPSGPMAATSPRSTHAPWRWKSSAMSSGHPTAKTIWYDLQTPRGEVFWLAGYNVETKERTWYHLERNEWSIHFNVTKDGKLFCGDGGDPGQVARATDGEWIYLFRPELIPNRGIEDKNFVNPGVLHSERLVNMSKHQYKL